MDAHPHAPNLKQVNWEPFVLMNALVHKAKEVNGTKHAGQTAL